MTFLPLFGHTEAVLGESSYEGSNELQMQIFQVFGKLDLNTFPMSYHGINLDAWKAFKRDLKVVPRVENILLSMPIFPVFDYDHGLSLMVDDLIL